MLGLLAAAALNAQVGDRADVDRSAPPATWTMPEAKLFSPTESLALFEGVPGFRVELVAAEPLVQDPISIQFDERGRIWVLEWPSYNWALRKVIPGLEPMDPPKSRVVVLEDTDGDGRMDRRTIFLDGLDWPRGLQLMRDGALVLNLPEIVLARDRDGDGRADQREVVVPGLAVPGNPHSAQSNLFRAMDNWIYGSKFSQRLRHSADGWRAEPYPDNTAQWGLSQDNFGRLLYASNGDHLRGDLVPAHYYARNPHYPAAGGINVRYATDQQTWPPGPTPGVNRRAQLRDADGRLNVFTSNTGPAVYRGDQFPPEFVGNVFLGEVGGRFIRRSVLTETEGRITARNAYEDREFLFSRDERFRPTFTTTGPDGALYVADMHRGVIEGDIFVTSFLRGQIIDRKLQHPFFGLGRIYRIVHGDGPRRPWPRIARADSAKWVPLLAHANGFWRDTAQRILVENNDRAVVPALRAMAREDPGELARLHALWTLDGLGAADPRVVTAALRDGSSRVRVAALRVSEVHLADHAVFSAVLALSTDPQVEVRRQWALSMGESRTAEAEKALADFLARAAAEPFVVEAVLSGLRDRELPFLQRLLAGSAGKAESPGATKVFSALAEAITNTGRAAEVDEVFVSASRNTSPQWLRLALLDGAARGKKPEGALPPAFAGLLTHAEDAIRARAAAVQKAWTEPARSSARRAPAGPVFERGQAMFAVCAACHGPEGKGQPVIAPPLEGSPVVTGPPEELLRSILLGRNLDRRNPAYPDMPALAGLGDEDIAAIASYVRARWSSATRAITPGQVRAVRDAASAATPAGSPTPPAANPKR